MKVCIDPGHSGEIEPGACAGGYTEAELNLAISQCIGEALETDGHLVVYTRRGEVDNDGLAWRAELANTHRVDLFLSVHCNGAASSQARGVETYHHTNAVEGVALAEFVQAALVSCNYTRDRGVKAANFAVLRLTDMPAILIECGFISSPDDRAVLIDQQMQKQIGAAVAQGIAGYLIRKY